jgi:hypothetical protein
VSPENIFPGSGKLSCRPKVFFPASGNFRVARKYFSRLREAFVPSESIFPDVMKDFRIPKVSGKSPGSFRAARWIEESEFEMDN